MLVVLLAPLKGLKIAPFVSKIKSCPIWLKIDTPDIFKKLNLKVGLIFDRVDKNYHEGDFFGGGGGGGLKSTQTEDAETGITFVSPHVLEFYFILAKKLPLADFIQIFPNIEGPQ